MNINRSVFGIYHPLHKLCLLFADVALIAIAFALATLIRLNSAPIYTNLEYAGINLILIFTLFLGGAYSSSEVGAPPKLPLKTFFTVLAGAIPGIFFIYTLGPERFTSLFGRGVFPIALFLFGVFAVISRFVINHLFIEQGKSRRALLLGADPVNEVIDPSFKQQIRLEIEYAKTYLLSNYKHHSYAVIVILPAYLPTQEEQQQLIQLRLSGIPVLSLSDFIESHLFLVPVHEIEDDWFIKAQGFAMLHNSVVTRIKRGIDILVALLLAVLSLPVTIVAAIAIKLTSSGSIFFSQTRVGLRGKEFNLYKFRTMVADAESEGAQWASDNDPRITKVGRFLRKTRIDELPQCWNILRGEMSIIGPRPERPEFTNMLKEEIPYYDLRHLVKPGLSGWAQVMYPYGASKEDALHKLQYDLFYIKNQSQLLDLHILLRTALVTFQRSGR